MDSEPLLKAGFGSAEGWTRVRARAWRGKRCGSERRLRRAASLVERSAADGCGDGRASRGVFLELASGLLGFRDLGACGADVSSASKSSAAAAVVCRRDCILWL